MANALSERLASVNERSRTSELEQLITETTTERDTQAALHVSLSGDAVNFRLAQADRDEAARGAERAARNAAMLDAAIVDLEAKLQARGEADKRASAEAERKNALAERDALAERIKAEWPQIVDQMTSLFDAIQSNDARMKAAGLYDSSAEAVARGCDGLFRFGVNQARRMTEMQVPKLGSFEMAWPRPRPVFDHGEVMRRQRITQAQNAAKEAARPSPFSWHRAKVSNGQPNPFDGLFSTGQKGTGQISNGISDIQITDSEAARLNAIPGVEVVQLAKAPERVTTFKHPAAA